MLAQQLRRVPPQRPREFRLQRRLVTQWRNTTYVGGCKPEPKTAWLLEIRCVAGAQTAVPSRVQPLHVEYSAVDKAKRCVGFFLKHI